MMVRRESRKLSVNTRMEVLTNLHQQNLVSSQFSLQQLLFLTPSKQSETFYFSSFALKCSKCFIFSNCKLVSRAGVFVSTNIYCDVAFKGGFQ